MTSKTIYVLMGINRMEEKYIVAVFLVHADAVQYADDWNIPSWHIYETQLF